MPFAEPGSIYSPGSMSLDDEIAQAKNGVHVQQETIARLSAEGHGVRDAEETLNSMLENLVFLIKLRSYAT